MLRVRIVFNTNWQDNRRSGRLSPRRWRGNSSPDVVGGVPLPLRLPGFFLKTREDGATHSEDAHIPGGKNVRDLVFGANDGLVAAFAVVSGVHGAAVSTRIILLAGLAELIGGTLAMGLGAFLASKSEREFILSEREREEREVREFPDEERKEVRTIYARKGFRGEALEQLVAHVTADPVFWVDTMMTEELGLAAAPMVTPVKSGLVVALAYALGAACPVSPYALPIGVHAAFLASIVATLLALFAAGAAKTFMTGPAP